MATPFLLGSYITCEEYRAEPTALNTNNLIPGGIQSQQDAELASLIEQASRKMDEWAWQPLYATPGAQQDSNVRIKDGAAVLHCRQDRVKAITSFAWGSAWTSLTTLTNPTVWIEENRVRVALSGAGLVWSGALNLNQPTWGTIFASWASVAGWATTRLTNLQNIGDTTITVDNPAGIVGVTTPGVQATYLRLSNGAVKNVYMVQSITGSVVTLSTPLLEAWPAGAGVCEAPMDVSKATSKVVSHYIKERAGTGVVMSRSPANASVKDTGGDEMAEARETAERYQRTAP